MDARTTLILFALSGCTMTRQTLDQTVHLFHDDLRWDRMPMAETVVAPEARPGFQQRHRTWGSQIRIVDIEPVQVGTGGVRGVARVHVQWIGGEDSTEVRDSVVEERWDATYGRWMLRSERVVAGDPGLLATAAPSRPVASPQYTAVPF